MDYVLIIVKTLFARAVVRRRENCCGKKGESVYTPPINITLSSQLAPHSGEKWLFFFFVVFI